MLTGQTMDYVPAIDTQPDENDPVRIQVLASIQTELAQTDTTLLHPSINTDISLALQNDKILPISASGMNMDTKLSNKYTNTPLDLQLIASHSYLRLLRDTSVNNLVKSFSKSNISNLLLLESIELQSNLESNKSLLDRKRKHLDDLIQKRKKQALDFTPINDFLDNRWNEKVNELIQLQLQLDSASHKE